MGNPKVSPNPTPVLLESKFVGTLDGQDATSGITVSIRAGGGPTGPGVAGLIPKIITLDGWARPPHSS